MAYTCIFTGLGNPGSSYAGTRHNAGALFVEELSKRERIPIDRTQYRSLVGRGPIAGSNCLLALPQTYMNLSGMAVKRMLAYTGTPPSSLVIAHDDLDLPLGRIRIRFGGSAGGHRGVASIIDHLQTGDFIRLKIGIGRPPAGKSTEDYVLSRFGREEKTIFSQSLERSIEASESLVVKGLDAAMNNFNANS